MKILPYDALKRRRSVLAALLTLAVKPLALAYDGSQSGSTKLSGVAPSACSWKRLNLPADMPATVSIIRGAVRRNGVVYVSTGGSQPLDGQCWKRSGDNFVKHFEARKYRINCLLVDPVSNDLYMGMGSQHLHGSAMVCKYDDADNFTRVGAPFNWQDIIYSMCWHDGMIHAGTMAEDVPGSARVAHLRNGLWINVFAPGVNGLPASYSYSGAYITFDFKGELHVGMHTRTPGHAHVWRRTQLGWVNLGCPFPDSTIVLANIEHDGKLVVCFSTDGSDGPVRSYNEITGEWELVGDIPAEWSGATIFNHMEHDAYGRLLVGVGGAPGKLSVWRLEDSHWNKIAGGVNESWAAPIGRKDKKNKRSAEWIYRLILQPDGKLLACVAAASANGAVGIWEMSET